MKGTFSKIWREIVYGGHILAFGNISIIIALTTFLNEPLNWPFLIIVYFGTLSVYKFDRIHDLGSDLATNVKRFESFKNKRLITIEILLSVIISVFLVVIYGNFSSLIFVFLLLLMGLGYPYTFKNISKKLLGFKNFFVPLPYALLPFFYYLYIAKEIDLIAVLFAIFVYFRLWMAVLFYDIKDIESDKNHGIITLAVELKESKTYFLVNLINYLSFLIIIISIIFKILPLYSLIFACLTIYTQFYLRLSKHSKDISTFSHIFCDGEFIIWGILIAIAKSLWG